LSGPNPNSRFHKSLIWPTQKNLLSGPNAKSRILEEEISNIFKPNMNGIFNEEEISNLNLLEP
jgi:hypothetical protein